MQLREHRDQIIQLMNKELKERPEVTGFRETQPDELQGLGQQDLSTDKQEGTTETCILF